MGGNRYADEVEGVVYNYVDIVATGTLIASGDDTEGTVTFGGGQTFDFYGNTLTAIEATTNGVLADAVGAAGDFSNDCPVPTVPSTGTGARIYTVHDDLSTSIYYEYFDAVAAGGVGYPGTTNGISVIQWEGSHLGGAANSLDFEVIIFHDDSSFLMMVEADPEGGSGSTIGIQDATASTGPQLRLQHARDDHTRGHRDPVDARAAPGE